MAGGERFRVLFVCTGNICRSPMGQVMLLHRLRERLGVDTAAAVFEVRSAGTYGLVGEPIDPDAVATLTELGITADPFEARKLDESIVADADLVLTATREHRVAAATLVGDVAPRTFTIREFARLVDGVVPDDDTDDAVRRLRALVAAAAAQRGSVKPARPDDDDVADPYRRSAAACRTAGEHIDAATRVIADRLAAAVTTANR
jgi:protein-tyrosine phosphatase